MTFTYLIADNVGKLRLAIADIDMTTTTGARSTWTALFTDEELGIFLTDASDDIFLAAAYALNSIAASRSLLAKMMRLGDFTEDLSKMADSLRAQAKSYEDLSASIANAPAGAAAEIASTDFGIREIIKNHALRTG